MDLSKFWVVAVDLDECGRLVCAGENYDALRKATDEGDMKIVALLHKEYYTYEMAKLRMEETYET